MGLLGCATVAEGGKEKNVPVRVLNVTEDPVTVYKGQSLAEFTEAMMNEGRTRDDATKTGKITYDLIAETTLGESISTEQKNRLKRLLRRYNKVFAYPGNEGQVTHIEHTIPLTTDNPIACRPRRLPTQWRPGVEEEVQELQRRGMIRPSESGYAAPVCPIKKRRFNTSLCRLSRPQLQDKGYGDSNWKFNRSCRIDGRSPIFQPH